MTDKPREPGPLNMSIRKDRTPLIVRHRPFQIAPYDADHFASRKRWVVCVKCGFRFRPTDGTSGERMNIVINGGPTKGYYCSRDCFSVRHRYPIYQGQLPFNAAKIIREEREQRANSERILTARLGCHKIGGIGSIQEARKRMASRQESTEERDIRVQADPEC